MIESDGPTTMLLLDVDGTLVDPSGVLYPGAQYLAKVGRRAGKIALCSARPIASLELVGKLLGGADILVGLQGAIACRGTCPPYLWAQPLKRDELAIVRALTQSLPLELWLYDEREWFCDSLSSAVDLEVLTIGISPIAGRNAPRSAYKLAVVDRSSAAAARLDELRLELAQQGIRCSRTHTHMLEVVASAVGPDKGISRLRLALGKEMTRFVAVGDGENDIGMLQAADLAFGFRGTDAANATQQSIKVAPASEGGLFEITKLLYG